MLKKISILYSFVIFIFTFSFSQYRNDFMIADSALSPFFDFDSNGKIHFVWQNFQKKDNSVYYVCLDSIGNIVINRRKISSTLASATPTLAIKNNNVFCVWEDRISLEASFFKTFIIGKILKDGKDYTNEIEIDDWGIVPTDGFRRIPTAICHNDTILYTVWCGGGSQSNPMLGDLDIYAQKLLFDSTLRKTTLLNYVLNNNSLKVNEYAPSVIKKMSNSGYLVNWIEKDSVNKWNIAGISCDDSLKPNSSKIIFKHFDTLQYNYISKPATIQMKNGNVLIVWEKDTTNYRANIYFQEFTKDGISVGNTEKVNEKYAYAASSVVADIDSEGNFIIIWEDGINLIAQRYFPSMSKIGSNFRINTTQTQQGDIYPCVRLRNGKIFTAWERFISGNPSVWMNILDFNNPTNVVEEQEQIPQMYFLSQNYPNPFNPSTTIEYSISSNANVKIVVFDLLGRQVKIIVDEIKSIGRYKIKFDASDLPSGVYFYRLQANEFLQTKKFVLLR